MRAGTTQAQMPARLAWECSMTCRQRSAVSRTVRSASSLMLFIVGVTVVRALFARWSDGSIVNRPELAEAEVGGMTENQRTRHDV
jgi:hypothetical protein